MEENKSVFIVASPMVRKMQQSPSITRTEESKPQPPLNTEALPEKLPTESDEVDTSPLPPGYEVAFDDKGRKFYVDHNAKTTSW